MPIYAFGSNGHGQLGVGHRQDVSVPQECLFTEQPDGFPSQLVSAGNLTILLFSDGQVFISGVISTTNDEVVQPKKHDRFQPLACPRAHRAKICSATWEACFIVTEADEVFVMGFGSKGELGLGPSSVSRVGMVRMPNFPPEGLKIVDIASSVFHTVAVLSNGTAYGWGNGRKGQLGLPNALVLEPRLIKEVGFDVRGATCGRDFSVLIGDPAKREVQVIGSDRWSVRSEAPEHIPDLVWIGATWSGVLARDADGSLRSWGRNDRGQLGLGELPRAAHSAAGSEHSIFLTDEGHVTCHGWGEHGNCGPNVDEAGYTPSYPVPIELPETSKGRIVVGVGAGCATSFIWTFG